MAKEYEIAFKLGAELESTFNKTFLKAADSMNKLQKETEKSEKAVDDFKKMMKGIGGGIATGIGAVFAGVSAGATGAFWAANNLDQSMRQIKASTGASAQEMAELEGIAKELYKNNLGENWEDLASAISQTRNVTKLSGKELETATANAIAFRDTFGEDIQESVKASDTMMKNFGISSEQAFNLLAQGAQKGLDKSGELLDSANEYGPYFAALGFEANQMFDTFSAGLESGAFNLDKVGDAVKEFNIRVKDGSKPTAEAFQALGMNAEQMAQTFAKGGPEAQKAFKKVVQAISSVKDPVKKNQIGVALMGTMFEDLEADVVAAMGTAQREFDMTKATMEEINKVKYDSAGQAIQGLWRQFEVGIIDTTVLPKLQEFSDYITENMPTIEKYVEEAIGTASLVIDKFSDSIKWAKDNSDLLIQATGFLVGSFTAFHIISAASKALAAYKAITATTTIAQYALNTAMSLNPIGLVATGIGLLIAAGIALYQNWDTVKEKAGETWESIKGIIRGPANSIIGYANGIIGAYERMLNAVGGIINKIPAIKIPDWVPGFGGKTFDIPDIPAISFPRIPMLAEGGIATGPTLAMIGEGAEQEAVLPLSKLANLLGLPSRGNQPIQVIYNPQYVIEGNADKETLTQVVLQTYQDFKRWMERYEFEKKRLRFN